MSNGKPPFISNVNHPTEVKPNTDFKVILDVDWPTPSWTHETTEIDIDDDNLVLTINYLGTRRAGVAMQVIKSFTTEFEIKLTKVGDWKIIILGRNENWESNIHVI